MGLVLVVTFLCGGAIDRVGSVRGGELAAEMGLGRVGLEAECGHE